MTSKAKVIVGIAATAVLLALALAASALAAPTRPYDSSFGTLTNPQALTVDQSTGDIYVTDPSDGTVSRFDSTGAADNFTCATCSGNTLTGFAFDSPSASQVAIAPAGAVGGTAGDIYVANSAVNGFTGEIDVFDSTGASLGAITQANGAAFGESCGVATDNAGKLYVGEFGGSVDRYVPTANPPTNGDYDAQITGVSSPCNLAADSTGAVYASTWSTGPLTKYLASDFGTSNPGTQIDATSTAVSLDPSTDDVYVDEGDQVHVFDSAGASRYTFGSSSDFGSNSAGVAVKGSAGNAYVADRTGGQIDVFGPVSNPPAATTNPATTIHHTDAILNGHLDPGDDPGITNCQFDFVDDAQFQIDGFASAGAIDCAQGTSYAAPADVSALANNLTPGTTYHFRLHLTTTSAGDLTGGDQTFTPALFPPAGFGADGTADTTFSGPQALAFDQSSARLYVLEQGHSRIDAFDASSPGTYPPLGGPYPLSVPAAGVVDDLAIDSSAQHLFYESEIAQTVSGFDAATGAPLGGGFPISGSSSIDQCGAALDPSGNLWVGAFGTQAITEYDPSGTPTGTTVDTSAQGSPCHLAFAPNGDLYVALYQGAVWRYTAASAYDPGSATEIDSGNAQALTVDPSNDHLYVAHPGSVSEYDASASFVGDHATGIAGASFAGVAVDASTHVLYVSDRGSAQVLAIGPGLGHFFPTVTPAPATNLAPTSATLNAKVDPEGFQVTDCHFDYLTDAAFQANPSGDRFAGAAQAPCAPDPASIGSGSGDVAVHADLSGLHPGTDYHFRIAASNASGTSRGAGQTFHTPGPLAGPTTATKVHETSATFTATVNPQGQSTTYQFQYATDAAFQVNGYAGASLAPLAPAAIGSGTADKSVAETVGGLQPATTYHVRVVATNATATNQGPEATFTTYASPSPPATDCPNQSFRTGSGAGLPDCRAYEQASPVDKNGADINHSFLVEQASPAGDRITFVDAGGLPTTGGTSNPAVYVASRGASAWTTNGLLAPSDPGFNAFLLGWDDQLSTSVSRAAGPPGKDGLYLGDTATGVFHRAVPLPAGGGDPRLAGFAADTSHLIFEDPVSPWTSDAIPGVDNLYDLDHGTLTLAGRIPAGSATTCDDSPGGPGPACLPAPGGSFAGPYDWAGGSSSPDLGGVQNGYYTQNTISADGSKVFFTAAGSGQLYMREDGTTTTRISASQAATPDPNGPQPAVFLGATPTGSKVFFSSCERLTDDSTAASPSPASACYHGANQTVSGAGSDLYSYDTASGELTDLSVDPAPGTDNSCLTFGHNSGPGCGASVMGFLGASADGSDVYFVANGAIAAGASPVNCPETGDGGCNLYLSHAGQPPVFLAQLAGDLTGDIFDWAPLAPITHARAARTARVASNGTLIFLSTRSLTGYDNTSPVPTDGCGTGQQAGEPCPELFRYSAAASGLACLSCNPTGARPIGPAGLSSEGHAFGALPKTSLLPRNISADGNRVFFETPEPLVAADTNGDSGCPAVPSSAVGRCTDVYEWEADGAGSCNTPGGCIYLLSSGTSSEPSILADVSASGDDAFIFTRDQLVPSDRDQLTDAYDVRVGGGLPSQHQTPSPPCSGDACQGGQTPPPTDPGSGSSTQNGPGNQGKSHGGSTTTTGKKCKKGKKGRKCRKSRHANANRGGSE